MSNRLMKSATIILAVTLVGRLLGLLRDSLIATTYGLSWELDVYNWIAMILLSLYMVIPGAFNAVYIPVMSKYLVAKRASGRTNQDGAPQALHPQEADRTEVERMLARRNELFQRVWTLVLTSFFLMTLLLYLFTPQVVSFLLPGASGEKLALSMDLFRLMLPAVFVMGIIGLLMSVSYSEQEFFIPSFGTVILSVTVILAIFLVIPFHGIYGLTIGTVAAYFFFAFLLIAVTVRKKYPLSLRLGLMQDPDLKRMGELFFPIILGMVISQSYFFINQGLASTLAEGAQAALGLAQKLYQLPPAIFVGAFTVPLLPILADLVKKNQLGKTKRILRQGLAYMHVLMLPTMVAFMVIGDTFIKLLFEYGEFTAEDTQKTYWALIFLSLALFPMAVRDMLTRTFYALEDTRTPVLIGLCSIGINFGVAVFLMGWLEHGAMALGYSSAICFDMLLLTFFLHRKIGAIYNRSYFSSFIRAALAAGGMGLFLWTVDFSIGTRFPVILLVPVYVCLGAAIYYFLLLLLKEETVREMQTMLLNRLKRSKAEK